MRRATTNCLLSLSLSLLWGCGVGSVERAGGNPDDPSDPSSNSNDPNDPNNDPSDPNSNDPNNPNNDPSNSNDPADDPMATDLGNRVDGVFFDLLSADECNTAGECGERYGDQATECLNAASSESVCMCGDDSCAGDECDTDEECQDMYPEATSCAFGDSARSICMCDDDRCSAEPPANDGPCTVQGDLEVWHRVAIECEGPEAEEESDATFMDYRMEVTFSSGATAITVPGHFAADGNAAESGATSGSVWRAYFMPTAARDWTYRVSMVEGDKAALTRGGSPVDGLDGSSGSFTVEIGKDVSNDLRTQGLLERRADDRYLRFRRTNEVFIDAGANSPENLLGFSDFDDTIKHDNANSCKGILHDFEPHVADWTNGDPVWHDDKGKGLIGLVNYLSSKDVNAMYFVGMNENGDGCDTYPWSSYGSDHRRFDVSKLDQWEIVFQHMQRQGIFIHYVTQETENDQRLDGGDLGETRRLYYREIISRFAHHPALQWNLGEENTNTLNQQRSFADFIRANDPYKHPLVIHTFPGDREEVYAPLLGFKNLDGPTMQVGGIRPNDRDDSIYNETRDWIRRSAEDGAPWTVTVTEASGGDAPEPGDPVTERQRVNYMWGNVMAGGGGFEWYLKQTGSEVEHAFDLAAEDLRELDELWTQTGHVATFFTRAQREFGLNLSAMEPANRLASNDDAWVLAEEGRSYIVFLRDGGGTELEISGQGDYSVHWFDPRTGEWTERDNVTGGGNADLGGPPSESSDDNDWVILVASNEEEANPPDVEMNPQADGDFVESDGYVVMEAESGGAPGEWMEATDIAGYTGSGYVSFGGNTICNGPESSPTEYRFSVASEGRRELRLRVAKVSHCTTGERHQGGECSESAGRGCESLAIPDGDQCPADTCLRTDLSNDAFVALYDEDGNYVPFVNQPSRVGEGIKMFGGSNGEFSWTGNAPLDIGGKRPALWDLAPGNYTFVMSGRSQQFSVDRIVFFNTEEHEFDDATFTDLPETR